jgi:hypothetical protein
MLTTKDNPFNPFVNYDAWEQWDEDNGYYTPQLVARVSNPSVDLSDEEQEALYVSACDFIITNDLTGMYTLIADPDENNKELEYNMDMGAEII